MRRGATPWGTLVAHHLERLLVPDRGGETHEMRLRKIHLAGFKSFVEPTTIPLPGDLIGVVGPNGCGKSNVIDAVRWVMGESSAKHLRSDHMSDVIFNGSTTRKPLGQASVELVFDNTEGRLGGQYAAYNEIAIRRTVGRDSQSTYSLNGTRCRRRDITDIFLGTGLGPRSYAIIEQGTISRLVEARPEELRDFLEEAAGISKYKERRRETENRIRHTRENLDRLSDLREELDKQLQRLKRQAGTAQRFRELKEQERQLRGEVLALRWRDLSGEVTKQEQAIAAQRNKVEEAIAASRHSEAEIEKAREEQAAASEKFNELYRVVLDAGSAVGRTEEAIQGMREQREQLRASLERESVARTEASAMAQDDSQKLTAFEAELEAAEPALEALEERTQEARDKLEQAEYGMQTFLREWAEFSQRVVEPAQNVQAERARIQTAEEQLGNLSRNTARLEAEALELETVEAGDELATLTMAVETASEALRQSDDRLHDEREHITSLRARVGTAEGDLHESRQTLAQLRGRQSSLEALQKGTLGEQTEQVSNWLAARGLDDASRLAENIEVSPGWELAVEVVLGRLLEALCVDDTASLVADLDAVTDGNLSLLGAGAGSVQTPADDKRLSGAILRGPDVVRALLNTVHRAADADSAKLMLGQLAAHESVVTAQGLWLGSGWARLTRGNEREVGVLAREQERRDVEQEIEATLQHVDTRTRELTEIREALQHADTVAAELERTRADAQENIARLRADEAARSAQREQQSRRLQAVRAELNDVENLANLQRQALDEARERLATALEQSQALEEEGAGWTERRGQLETALQADRASWQTVRHDAYEARLRVESVRTQIEGLKVGQSRLTARLASHEQRCEELNEALYGIDSPLEAAQAKLTEELESHRMLEGRLGSVRADSEGAEAKVRELDGQRAQHEQLVEREREALNELRLRSQEVVVRRDTISEQMTEAEYELQSILENLDPEATEPVWSEQMDALERRISRLGPINLAAIDEFETESERKAYLDSQHQDLTDALETLESAIQKIDRETRARFKETFEKVNDGLKDRFPRLFGGGHAELELTGDDLLSTGVTVIARPPGKRNASISQLSGGEKAMTAVALVFAIFELNPSPFCLLDEVDAPLDDANVGRFSQIIQEMSERVQVMFVTHNKGTMEVAQQLIGVTMNEPGVSRLVAVNVDEAMEMVAV
ncbi:MAG: chromosome segregation protein SMC [Gammaproteobacteria bacterium]|nr:chromosome segregation protein SMC [Gammaproteobacteria bacterium]